MTPIEKILKLAREAREKAENVGNWRSDDFGHNCQRLLEAESAALGEVCNTDIPELAAAVERLAKALELAIEQRDEWSFAASINPVRQVEFEDRELTAILEGRDEQQG